MTEQKQIDEYFFSLIISLSAAAMQQLGKIANPVTNKIEKSVEQAKISIDMLIMLREKTKGNLSVEENKLLDSTISDLQLNYVDECEKHSPPASKIN
ncbi:MAG: hypothetical protein A2474_02720 [Elusimicrobia bacterium RIFOXYC2_FULL_34_12]|nr:MAG: hypothetical protein A2474_02720 [Elusimicrobia bacterium RIFOXYC2_FULL_34_12]HAM38352.1 DUF1844 domain-containing protein [Elusimicrobiota bacterium]